MFPKLDFGIFKFNIAQKNTSQEQFSFDSFTILKELFPPVQLKRNLF